MKKKRGLLHQLIIAIFIPAFLALILAWVVYNQFESTMRAVSGNYVENLVDSVAARLDSTASRRASTLRNGTSARAAGASRRATRRP